MRILNKLEKNNLCKCIQVIYFICNMHISWALTLATQHISALLMWLLLIGVFNGDTWTDWMLLWSNMIICSLLPKILISLSVFKTPYWQITILVDLLFQCFARASAYEIPPRTSSRQNKTVKNVGSVFSFKWWTNPADRKNDARSLSVQNS